MDLILTIDVGTTSAKASLFDAELQFIQFRKREEKNMAYKINENCISCGTCEGECPVEAISAGDDKYVIDPETCIDCGACAAVCPVSAIES